MKWISKPWDQSAENTMEFIIDQIWGALPFPWKIPIMKGLNLSGMVSPQYVRFRSPYSILTLCDMP